MTKNYRFFIFPLMAMGLALMLAVACKKDDDKPKKLPEVQTLPIANVTNQSATSGGNVIEDGGSEVTERGVCWGTNPNPTIENSKLASGSGTGNFVSQITGLNPATAYYLRAYATSSVGTAYGYQFDFTTTSSTLTAAFMGSPTSGNAPLTVNFTDQTSGAPTGWQWDFGDGNTSNQQNPVHIYQSAGTYTVKLTVTSGAGSATETKNGYITVTGTTGEAPVAAFSANPTSGAAPLTVNFTDQSTNTPTSWQWNFGDGNTSTQQNPVHIYQNNGNYTVVLVVTNSTGSGTEIKNNYIVVSSSGAAPVAAFSANPTSGIAPLTVNFTDQSTNAPTSWQWNFGDGTTSTEQNPMHVYQNAGNYTVSLNVTNSFGNSSEVKNNYINVTGTTTSFFEGFEGSFPPAGWLKLNPDGGSGWETLDSGTSPIPGWGSGTANPAPEGGSKMAWATYLSGGGTSNDQWLVTPQLTVASGDVLKFYLRYWPNSYDDKVDIRISTGSQNNVSDFDIIVAELEFDINSGTDWQLYTFNLNNFVTAGTSVYIAFREHIEDNIMDGAAIFLDNVYVGQPTRFAVPRPVNRYSGNVSRNSDFIRK